MYINGRATKDREGSTAFSDALEEASERRTEVSEIQEPLWFYLLMTLILLGLGLFLSWPIK
jgi:hypothetical protein